jgi:hypothetical protein
MSDDFLDPYDINNYVKPVTNKKNETKKNKKKEKNNFEQTEEIEENNDNDLYEDEEEKPLKKKKDLKRKTTDEELPQNIDLTKNAYEDNTNSEKTKKNVKNKPFQYNNNDNNDNTNEEDEEELPLLEELGINPQTIKNKMISILILRKIDKKFLEESDMAGPFLIILIFAFSLVLQYKTCFGYLYGISVFGSFFIFLLLNLMSKERGILLYNTISVLGYCMIPIVILSFISVFLDMKGIVGGILCFLVIIASSISASRFFEIALNNSNQKWLIFYPVCLFYTCFVLVSIF